MELVLPDGTRIPYFKPKKPVVTEVRTIEHVVDNKITRIDHGDDDDDTHILLQGNLNSSEYFIRCINPQAGGENYFEVRYDGSIKCPNVFSDTTTQLLNQQQTLLDGHNELITDVNVINDIVLDHDWEIGQNNLVSRNNDGDSEFRKISSSIINIVGPANQAIPPHINLMDGALYYTPLVTARLATANYRFGLNENEFDYAGGGDGIEFLEHGTHLLVQASDTAPCINIKSDNVGVPIFRIQDTNEDSIVEVNSDGTTLRTLQSNALIVKSLMSGDQPNIVLEDGFVHFKKSTTRESSGAVYRIGLPVPGSTVDGIDFRENADNRIHLQCADLSIPLLNIRTIRTDDTDVLTCDIDSGVGSNHVKVFGVRRDGLHTSGIRVRDDEGDSAQFIVTAVGDITKCRDINSRDIECRDITCSDKVECEDLEILNTGSGDDVMAFRIFRDADDPSLKKKVFSITNSGQIRSTFSEQNDLLNAFEDGSVFIGSARYGYKRVSHEPTVEVLKQNYIPKYLTDLGVTLSNYSNYTSFDIDNLTVKRWVKLAEEFTGDDHHPSQVFPAANAAVDFVNAIHKHANVSIEALETAVTALENASGSLGTAATIENLSGSATLQLSSTASDSNDYSSISILVDHLTNNLLDHHYAMRTGPSSNEWSFQSEQADNTWKTCMRFAPTGQCIFGEATNYNLADFRVKGTSYFDLGVTMNSTLTVQGTNVKDALDNLPSGPLLERNTVHMTPGSYPNWPLWDDDLTVFIHDTNSTSRYRLPANPTDGQQISIYCASGSGLGTINLHTGGTGPTFHTSSTGYASTVQANLNSVGTQRFKVVYIDATTQWLLI